MSVRSLEQEIKRRIIEAVKGAQLLDIQGNLVSPIVETGALPKKTIRGTPYILIQTTKINDDDTGSSSQVSLLYGTVGMSEENQKDVEKIRYTHSTGHWDLISIIDKIRDNFLKNTNFTFGILDRSIEHEVFGEVDFPYFLGETKCKFTIGTIMPQDDYF
jgi:hypothetical protein